jgi:hypothetical protein
VRTIEVTRTLRQTVRIEIDDGGAPECPDGPARAIAAAKELAYKEWIGEVVGAYTAEVIVFPQHTGPKTWRADPNVPAPVIYSDTSATEATAR